MEKAYMDSIITKSPYQGDTWVFTNHKDIRKIDEQTGEEHISYEADADLVPCDPDDESIEKAESDNHCEDDAE